MDKPTVYNYVKAEEEIARLKEKVANLEIRCRIAEESHVGKWQEREEYRLGWTCSECGEYAFYAYDFCPNCGAKME